MTRYDPTIARELIESAHVCGDPAQRYAELLDHCASLEQQAEELREDLKFARARNRKLSDRYVNFALACVLIVAVMGMVLIVNWRAQ